MKNILAAAAAAMTLGAAAPVLADETARGLARTLPEAVGQVAPALAAFSTEALFGGEWGNGVLSPRDRALVTLATLITRHETDLLNDHLALALDAGVTPAEVSEMITHLAFYTGWGNAIAAARAAAPIFAARGVAKADLPAVAPPLLPLNEKAEAAREAFVSAAYGGTSPGVVKNTREILFLNLWLRPGLKPRDRSMITVAALIAAGQPEQMTFHLNRAMDNGLTRGEAGAMLSHLAFYAGWPKVFSALPVAGEVFGKRTD